MKLSNLSIKSRILFIALLSVGIQNPANADMNDSMDKMCGKIKSCAMKTPEMESIPDEMKAMMMGMFDSMCATKLAPYANVIEQEGLEDVSKACVDSFLAESCESLLANKGEYVSEECEEAEKAAKEAGVDFK